MGILEDLSKAGQSAIKDVSTGISHLGNDAKSALDQATRNTASLAGSGVNASGQIFGPVADMFGKDPTAFVLNVAKQTKSKSRELLVRVAERTGKLSYVFPTPQGTRKVTAKPTTSASANQIALTLVLAAMDAPATMAEEAGRMAHGLPVKERGLSGFTIFPMSLPSAGKERGLFGIDDAIILTVIVPILAQIAVVVLPGLIAAASGALQQVTNPTPKGPTPEEQAAAQAQEDQQKTMVTVGIVVVVLLIGGVAVFAATRKKKAA